MGFDVSVSAPFGRVFVRAGRAGTTRAERYKEHHGLREFDWKADLVHVSYAFVSLPLLHLKRSSRLVYTIHGTPQPELESEPLFKIGYLFEQASLKHVARRATRVVAISNFVRDLLKTN